MFLWDTPISSLQFFGYAISLGGLIYYKLGPEQLRASFETIRSRWTAFSGKNPITKTLTLLFTVVTSIFIFFGILVPKYAPDYDLRTFLLSGAASVGLT
jgi:CBS domain containing-hemolysin-like protein